jgi:hypothetical protein
MGQDLFAMGYVENIPDIWERITFKRDKVTSNDFTIKVRNNNDFFSTNNSVSMFSGNDWLYQNLLVYNEDEIKTWDGLLTNIRTNHREKMTYLECKDNLFKLRKLNVTYESADWENPGTALENIFSNAGLVAGTDYDNTSLQKSITKLTDEACDIKVNYNESDGINFYDAISEIGIYACMDIYLHNNLLYCVHWEPFSGGVSLNLTGSNLKTAPIVNYLEREMLNDYIIHYDGDLGIAAIDSANNNIGNISRQKYGEKIDESVRSGEGAQIQYQDLGSAVYIGECYIRRSNYNLSTSCRPLIKIQFDLDIKYRYYTQAGMYFKLTLSDEEWTEKIFQVMEHKRNEDQENINIVAYEIIE